MYDKRAASDDANYVMAAGSAEVSMTGRNSSLAQLQRLLAVARGRDGADECSLVQPNAVKLS